MFRPQNVFSIVRHDYVVLAALLIGFWASLTPSLLPRPWVLQVIVSSLTIVCFYWIGLLLSLGLKALSTYTKRLSVPVSVQYLLAVSAALIVLYELISGAVWQYEMFRMIGLSPPGYLWVTSSFGVVAGTIVLSGFFIWLVNRIGRLVKLTYSKVRHQRLVEKLPYLVGVAVSVTVVSFVVIVVTNGLFPRIVSRLSNSIYDAKNDIFPDGYEQPTSPFVSGGPGSLTPWTTLGQQGRKFVAGGPTTADIESVMGIPAKQPIRVYVGLEQSSDLAEQASIAVRELERTAAHERKAVLVAITTGSGWVDAGSTRPLEYLFGGDVATVAIQYSYLPSILSYVSDKQRATESAQQIITQVSAFIADLPEDERPDLYVFGESLGSYGIEQVYAGDPTVDNAVTATFLVGAPGFNVLHSQFVSMRNPGTPSFNPVFGDGSRVVFAIDQSEYAEISKSTQLLYLENPSDPVSKLNAKLLWSKPPWIDEQKKAGLLSEHFVWRPIVTFFQVGIDMSFSRHAPSGFGHNYGALTTGAWARITGIELSDSQSYLISESLD